MKILPLDLDITVMALVRFSAFRDAKMDSLTGIVNNGGLTPGIKLKTRRAAARRV